MLSVNILCYIAVFSGIVAVNDALMSQAVCVCVCVCIYIYNAFLV